jgi:hypothetical protein
MPDDAASEASGAQSTTISTVQCARACVCVCVCVCVCMVSAILFSCCMTHCVPADRALAIQSRRQRDKLVYSL